MYLCIVLYVPVKSVDMVKNYSVVSIVLVEIVAQQVFTAPEVSQEEEVRYKILEPGEPNHCIYTYFT